MHSATTATGRPLPPPGKTPPKNRPAPPSCRAAHQLAAPKPHATSQLQCYIPAPAVTRHSSPATSHARSIANPAIRIRYIPYKTNTRTPNQSQTNVHSAFPAHAGSSTSESRVTNHESRQSLTRYKWTLSLEQIIRVTHSKQTIAPILIRYKQQRSQQSTLPRGASLIDTKTRCLRPGWGSGTRLLKDTSHGSRITDRLSSPYISGWRYSKLMRRLSIAGRSPESRST